MFRLHRSDRMALAVILLAASLGLLVLGGSGSPGGLLGLAPPAVAAPHTASASWESSGGGTERGPLLAAGPGLTPVRGPGMALRLTSAPTGFSLTGTYAGWMSLEEGDLVFRVPEAVLRTRHDVSGDQELVGIRLALARGSGTSWTTVEESPLFPVRAPLRQGGDYTLRDVELRIGGIRSWDLRDAWPVIVHELRVASADPAAHSGPAWTYVHGTRDSLEALRRTVERDEG